LTNGNFKKNRRGEHLGPLPDRARHDRNGPEEGSPQKTDYNVR
jgi:hypothetical protein